MAAIAIMSLSEASTGVAVVHTFTPKATNPMALWRQDVASVPVSGSAFVTIKVKTSKGGDSPHRIQIELADPVMEATLNQNAAGYTAPPKVAYISRARTDYLLPLRSTAIDRKRLRLMNVALHSDPQVADTVDNVAAPY